MNTSPVAASNGTRRCPRCRQCKPVSHFSRNSRAYDGRYSYCKPCARLMRGVYRNLGTVTVHSDPSRIDPAPTSAAPTVRVGHIDLPIPPGESP